MPMDKEKVPSLSLLGLISPLKGSFKISNSQTERHWLQIPQSSSFSPPPVKVSEFVALAAPGCIFSNKRKNSVSEALNTVWLQDKKNPYIRHSGGEKQRLHIARALA